MLFHLEIDSEILIDDGELLAVRQCNQVEVWAANGAIFYGYLPETVTDEVIRIAARFYMTGFLSGVRVAASIVAGVDTAKTSAIEYSIPIQTVTQLAL